MKSHTICLVSGSHVCTNPRLVKEAHTLHDAGYHVHVIAGRYHSPYDDRDQEILAQVQWKYTLVSYGGWLRGLTQKITRKVARGLMGIFPSSPMAIAARAHHAASAQIANVAESIPADLYIGHTLVGLYAASAAARSNGAKLGFDAEDFHSQETEFAITDRAERHAIRRLESGTLPKCQYLTAASPLIAQAYCETYSLALPITIQNTFPLSEAAAKSSATQTIHSPARIYWFSQTIGAGRGLEQLIRILSEIAKPIELNLRGRVSQSSYPESLRKFATQVGFSGKISILPTAPASEMARLAAEHDFGVASEISTPPNRDICLTNKIYTYLLAGLPILCTPTTAQKQLASELGSAVRFIELNDPKSSARIIEEWITDKGTYTDARGHAWKLGQTRFNWDTESKQLRVAIDKCLGTPGIYHSPSK